MKRPTNRDLEKIETEILVIASEIHSLGEVIKAMSTSSYPIKPESVYGLGTLLEKISKELNSNIERWNETLNP